MKEIYTIHRPILSRQSLLDALCEYTLKAQNEVMKNTSIMNAFEKDSALQPFLVAMFTKAVRRSILDQNRLAQNRLAEVTDLRKRPEGSQQAREPGMPANDVDNRLLNGLRSVPGRCPVVACSADFPANLKLRRELQPDGSYGYWIVSCWSCGSLVRRCSELVLGQYEW